MTNTTSSHSQLVSQVNIKGYKSIEDVRVHLKPGLNIVIGKNGAGKSNFLEALDGILSSIFNRIIIRLKNASLLFGGGDEILYTIERQNVKTSPTQEELLLLNDAFQKKLDINGENVFDSTLLENKEITFKGKRIRTGNILWSLLSRIGIRHLFPLYIRFDSDSEISGISVPTTIKIPLEPHGSWDYDSQSALIAIAFNIAEEAFFDEFDKIDDIGDELTTWDKVLTELTPAKVNNLFVLNQNVEDNLRLVTPIKSIRFNKNISVYRDDNHLILDNLKLDFLVNDNWLPWSQLSDGTKRLFFIVTDISLNKHGITLVEEPELGVHPHQFNLVMQFLKEQSEDQQIVISTHSPKALDVLAIDELDRILLAKYEKGKGTQIVNMSENQKQKALSYIEDIGFLSDYWLMSDLEE